jgi:hypothetical protein
VKQPSPYSDGYMPGDHGEPYIRTFSGRKIFVRDPALNDRLYLVDFAYGLARIARFTGQTSVRYSVASHSLMVADLLPVEFRASGLLHDAVEAVLGDVSSPLKSLLPDYKALQTRWTEAMADRWGVPLESPAIKTADRLAYAIERRDLCPYGGGPQGWDIEHELAIPPSAPRCSAYGGRPALVGLLWLGACRQVGIPEVA